VKRRVNVTRLGLAALVLALSAGCGPDAPPKAPETPKPLPAPVTLPPAPASRETPDAPFRARAPGPDGQLTFTSPKPEMATLSNGLRVLIVSQRALPVVAVRLVITSGVGDVPGARPGAVTFLGSMLEQGTKKRSALQISDDYEALGVQHGAWLDWDSGGVAIKALPEKLDAALEIMTDVALAPTFPQAEIDRLRARRIAAIRSERSSPGTLASNALGPALYGRAHPYGRSQSGEEADAEKLSQGDLVKLYERLWSPKNAAIVVAGDVTRESIVPKLEAAFGTWKPSALAAARKAPAAPPANAKRARVVLVDKPGPQSQIQIARVGVPYGTKDREAMVVANSILGGMFSSRVNMNLRERNAYTYGARSWFAMRHGAGPFAVSAAVFADKTVPAIEEVMKELEGLRKGGPTEEELALAKESWLLAMPGRFETVADVATAFGDLLVQDLPTDDFDKRRARVEAVTAADVQRVAKEWFAPESMTIVVVGDKAKLEPELAKLGAVEERDSFGNVVAKGETNKVETKPEPKKPEATPKK
jgi:zinc protease